MLQEWLLGSMTFQNLVSRIGSEHVERRLKAEADHEAQLIAQGLPFFNLENWRLAPGLDAKRAISTAFRRYNAS